MLIEDQINQELPGMFGFINPTVYSEINNFFILTQFNQKVGTTASITMKKEN